MHIESLENCQNRYSIKFLILRPLESMLIDNSLVLKTVCNSCHKYKHLVSGHDSLIEQSNVCLFSKLCPCICMSVQSYA